MLVLVRLEIVLILTQDGCTVWVERTIRSEIAVRHTQWISYVTLVMWNVVSVYLKIVLVSVQDEYTVCVKRTIGIENHFGRTQWYS
jgi:uncharacterized protein with PQ loop repeat